MELGIPEDYGARLYMELESLEPKIRWVYMELRPTAPCLKSAISSDRVVLLALLMLES